MLVLIHRPADSQKHLEAATLTSISGQAPGKLVLSGEYITLLGSPALVIAVDRYAIACVTIKEHGGWEISSNISPPQRFQGLSELLASTSIGLVPSLLQALPNTSALPEHAHVHLDTRTFFENEVKLGIGSSAAILVALAQCISHITNHRFQPAELIDIHNAIQGGRGSGLDIVSASLGGLTRFQQGEGVRVPFPPDLYFKFVFTGHSTATKPMVAKFHELIAGYPKAKINEWQQLATKTVAASSSSSSTFLTQLAKLNAFVTKFDQETSLGIYSDRHREATRIAARTNTVYKPSGAGGGDMGIAMSSDPTNLNSFERQALQAGLKIVNLNMSDHGATLHF